MVVYPLKGTALQSREMLDAHPKPFFFVFCDVFLSCAPLGATLGVHTPFVQWGAKELLGVSQPHSHQVEVLPKTPI